MNEMREREEGKERAMQIVFIALPSVLLPVVMREGLDLARTTTRNSCKRKKRNYGPFPDTRAEISFFPFLFAQSTEKKKKRLLPTQEILLLSSRYSCFGKKEKETLFKGEGRLRGFFFPLASECNLEQWQKYTKFLLGSFGHRHR